MQWNWLACWWRQIAGPTDSDPWEDDPIIRAERESQHDRINKANRGEYYDNWNRRVRESWRPRRYDAP